MRRTGSFIVVIACVIAAVGMLVTTAGIGDASLRRAFVGRWNLVGVAWDDESESTYGSGVWLELSADGTATYGEPDGRDINALNGSPSRSFDWAASSESTATIDVDGRITPMLVSGDRLTIETDEAMLTFERDAMERPTSH